MMPDSSFSVQQLHQQHAHAPNSSASPPHDRPEAVAVAGGRQTTLQQEHQSTRSMGCWKTVQQLNNLGCVNVTIGNYPEANRLFELALKKHMAISEYVTSGCCHGCAVCYNDIDTTARCNCHSTDDTLSLSSADDIECGENCYMEDDESMISNDDDSSTHSIPRMSQDEVLTPSGAIGSDPVDSNDYHRIPRMTTYSKLPCSSSSNNNNNNKTAHTNCHEVYCLPIVMDNLEWRSSSLDEKTFVLVFNTAMCNQLWGMYFQQQETHGSLTNHQSNEAFLVAEKLYRLALNNVCGVGSLRQTRHSSARHHCQLYFLAGLNNLSHAVKTLYGSHSSEALKIDRMLLTAIFWWRDSRHQGRGFSRPSSSDTYDNADDEIVHLFLQHVFHLVGSSESLSPAAAA